jgi:hypothetical protein
VCAENQFRELNLPFSEIHDLSSRVPRPIRGTFRDRHERWVEDAMDALVRETKRADADGKIVWSWRHHV